jgi:hypothetical protein
MASHKLGQVFETMMEKRQFLIPSEGFYGKKKEKRTLQLDPNAETLCAEHCSDSKGKRPI